LCGDGGAQDVGYAPIAAGAGSYLPDMSNHGAHAPEVDGQHSSDLHGVGSTRPVVFRQVSLGEEHVHLVKSMVEQHGRIQKSQCRLCSLAGARGASSANHEFQTCTCAALDAGVVAKAIVQRMSNAQRVGVRLDDVAQWVRDVAKAGFRLPVPDKARSLGSHVVDDQTDRGPKKGPKRSISDQVRIDDSGGHLRPSSKSPAKAR